MSAHQVTSNPIADDYGDPESAAAALVAGDLERLGGARENPFNYVAEQCATNPGGPGPLVVFLVGKVGTGPDLLCCLSLPRR